MAHCDKVYYLYIPANYLKSKVFYSFLISLCYYVFSSAAKVVVLSRINIYKVQSTILANVRRAAKTTHPVPPSRRDAPLSGTAGKRGKQSYRTTVLFIMFVPSSKILLCPPSLRVSVERGTGGESSSS